MGSHARVQTELTAEDAKLQAALKRGESSIRSYGSKVASGLKVAAGAFLGLGAAAVGAVAYMAKLYGVQERAEAKLAAVLKATGNAAGYSTDQLRAMAADLQKVTTYGDETTISAMAVLATFKEIRGEQFQEATKAAMDMSAVLGTDLQGSMIQLGKALNDPIKGVMALADAGVSFTAQQREQIKALQESGDIVGAQKIVLEELKGEFGGTAETMAGTFGGQVTQLKNRLGDLGEQIGRALMPALTGLVEGVGNFATWLEASMPSIQRWFSALAEVGNVLWDIGTRVVNAFYTGMAAAISAVQTVIENFGDTMRFVFIGASYQVVRLGNVLAHWFTKVIPDFLAWFGRNWSQIFTDLFNFTTTVFTNMAKNIWEFFQQVAAWLRGEGFAFKWTGLTDGFEATLDELPRIAERIPGELEKALGDETAQLGAKLGSEFGKNFAANSAAMDQARRDLYGLPAEGGGGPSTDMTPHFTGPRAYEYGGGDYGGGDKAKKKEAKEKTGSFEDLGALYKRIASSAASRAEDRTAKATERTADAVEELVELAGNQQGQAAGLAVLGV